MCRRTLPSSPAFAAPIKVFWCEHDRRMIMLDDLKRVNGLDLLLTLAIVAGSASFVRFLGIEPSPTRTIFVAYALAGTAGVALLRRGRGPTTTTWLALGLLAMAFVGYFAWLPSEGSWISLNIWSEWVLCFAFLVFGIAFGARRWHVWRTLLIILAVVVAMLQMAGLVLFQPLLESRHGQWGPADFYGSRALHANLAMLMVAGLVCALRHPALSTRLRIAVGLLLGVSVMISQWRTVWLAMFAALVVLGIEAFRTRRPQGVGPATVAVAAVSVVFLILPSVAGVSLLPGSSVTQVGSVALPSSATSGETLTWRVEMWQSRLNAPRSLEHIVGGGVLGADNVVYPGTGIMNGYMSGHNVFLDVYVAAGLIGVALVVALLTAALARRGLHQDDVGICVIAAIVFGLSFFWPPWLWVILGVALSSVHPEARGRDVPSAAFIAESP